MIFYKPLEISANYLKIEFCPNFVIDQNIQIFDFEDWLQNTKNDKITGENLKPRNYKKLSILGKITQINPGFTLIKTFKTLENLKIENLVVQVLENKNILSFSPTLLGCFWSNYEFLEGFWQEEEKTGKLLGSRLLTGKIIEYGQSSPNWKNNSQDNLDSGKHNWQNQNKLIKPAKYQNNPQIALNLTCYNSILKETYQFQFDIKMGDFNFLPISNQNSKTCLPNFLIENPNLSKPISKINLIDTFLQIIEQMKSNFDQPIFLIMTSSLSILQLKDFYFKLLESENLFNSFVLDSRHLNAIIFEEIWELADFLSQNLEKKVFVISELSEVIENKTPNQMPNRTKNWNKYQNPVQNPNITFIQIET